MSAYTNIEDHIKICKKEALGSDAHIRSFHTCVGTRLGVPMNPFERIMSRSRIFHHVVDSIHIHLGLVVIRMASVDVAPKTGKLKMKWTAGEPIINELTKEQEDKLIKELMKVHKNE